MQNKKKSYIITPTYVSNRGCMYSKYPNPQSIIIGTSTVPLGFSFGWCKSVRKSVRECAYSREYFYFCRWSQVVWLKHCLIKGRNRSDDFFFCGLCYFCLGSICSSFFLTGNFFLLMMDDYMNFAILTYQSLQQKINKYVLQIFVLT